MESPSQNPPSSSELSSISSPTYEENKTLNTRSLLTLLEKLQKWPKYRHKREYIPERSVAGGDTVYVKNRLDPEMRPMTPGEQPPTWSPATLARIEAKLQELAEKRKSESDPSTPSKIWISIDNESVFYYPERSDFPRTPESGCPGSNNSGDLHPYYNLRSPSTMRFIQVQLNNPRRAISQSHTPVMTQSFTDESTIVNSEITMQTVHNVPTLSRTSSGIMSPSSAALTPRKVLSLQNKLRELAPDVDMTEVPEPTEATMSPDSDVTTPLDISSPHTKRKLMYALTPLSEPDVPAVVDIEGQTRLFILEEEALDDEDLRASRTAATPNYNTFVVPEAIIERLSNLQEEQSGTDSSDAPDN